MEWLLYIVGILFGFAVLAAAVVATLAVYFGLCAWKPAHKVLIEVLLVVFVLSFSLIVRLIIAAILAPEGTFAGGASELFKNLFGTIASFTFNGDFAEAGNGVLACFYYGVVVYASIVFLTAVTAGLSYGFYSFIHTAFMRLSRSCKYYIFTAVTNDSLGLAESIKKHHEKQRERHIIIFFENGEESFSKKNPLHRRLMEQGFFYFSDPRRSDKRDGKGDTISFLQWFKFSKRHFPTKDKSKLFKKQFYVIATNDCGNYENANSDVIFDDATATLRHYVVKDKSGNFVDNIPTVVNYFLLTGGEINYESYERRREEMINDVIGTRDDEIKRLTAARKDVNKTPILWDEIDGKMQINVFNEATLSSYDLVFERNAHLDTLGEGAFEYDTEPREGAYRVAIIGFGKTGQYAMEELYTHSTHIYEGDRTVQFIADVYDARIDEKSGLFAYNHPLFKCIDDEYYKKFNAPADSKDGDAEKDKADKDNTENKDKSTDMPSVSNTQAIIKTANSINGKAFDILYTDYEVCKYKKAAQEQGKDVTELLEARDEKTRAADKQEARQFVNRQMGFPIAFMHQDSCFKYPFIDKTSAETAIATARNNGVRDFVVALGNDESDIAMANIIIDSFRRDYVCNALALDKPDHKEYRGHVTIYVNLIEERSRVLLNWRALEDVARYNRPYRTVTDPVTNTVRFTGPKISVIPFGSRQNMYSYDNLIEDYRERLYNYGYKLFQGVLESSLWNQSVEKAAREKFATFKQQIEDTPNKYLTDPDVVIKWREMSQFLRLSNKSAHAFSVRYYKLRDKYSVDGEFKDEPSKVALTRLEHDRWQRFFIAHGWSYVPYKRLDPSADKKQFRAVRQHNCLCTFDVMLDDYTKLYDEGNVKLGFLKSIVYPLKCEKDD